jgi:hypothetical protein
MLALICLQEKQTLTDHVEAEAGDGVHAKRHRHEFKLSGKNKREEGCGRSGSRVGGDDRLKRNDDHFFAQVATVIVVNFT